MQNADISLEKYISNQLSGIGQTLVRSTFLLPCLNHSLHKLSLRFMYAIKASVEFSKTIYRSSGLKRNSNLPKTILSDSNSLISLIKPFWFVISLN